MNKKIFYVTDSLSVGGAERQLALLVKYLPPEWVGYVFSLDGGKFVDVICHCGVSVEVHKRTWRYDPLPFIHLLIAILNQRPNVVHSWGWMCSTVVGPLCRILDIPFIDGSIRIGWAPRSHFRRAKLTFSLAKIIIANSEAGLKAWKIPDYKGRIIYNGFDPERLLLIKNSQPHQQLTPLKIIMTARMANHKDYETFLLMVRYFNSNKIYQNRVRVTVIGDGVLREKILKQNFDLINSGILSFPEPTLEVLPYVRTSNIGVLLTNPDNSQEGCSNSIMEYMFCSLPVICSEGGGNRELVVDGQTGFVIPAKNPKILINKILYYLENPDQVIKMGEAGKIRAYSKFSVGKMVSNTIKVYEEVMNNA